MSAKRQVPEALLIFFQTTTYLFTADFLLCGNRAKRLPRRNRLKKKH
jgi:hypothetical protein